MWPLMSDTGCWLCRCRKGPGAKECGKPLEAGKARNWILPWSLQREDSPANLDFVPVR